MVKVYTLVPIMNYLYKVLIQLNYPREITAGPLLYFLTIMTFDLCCWFDMCHTVASQTTIIIPHQTGVLLESHTQNMQFTARPGPFSISNFQAWLAH